MELTEKYVKKGTKLYIEGSLHHNKYTDGQGTEKIATEIKVQPFGGLMIILSAKKTGEDEADRPPTPERTDDKETYKETGYTLDELYGLT